MLWTVNRTLLLELGGDDKGEPEYAVLDSRPMLDRGERLPFDKCGADDRCQGPEVVSRVRESSHESPCWGGIMSKRFENRVVYITGAALVAGFGTIV